MSEHPNAVVLRRVYDAFAAGDIAALAEDLDPSITLHASGHSWLAGEYRGRDAVLAFLGSVAGFADLGYILEVHRVLGDETGAVGLHRSTARRSDGRVASIDNVLVVHVAAGKVTDVWGTPWDQYAEDAFYGVQPPSEQSAPRTSEHTSSWTVPPSDAEV
jgi:uncharacterized protein